MELSHEAVKRKAEEHFHLVRTKSSNESEEQQRLVSFEFVSFIFLLMFTFTVLAARRDRKIEYTRF